jgi:hypothetical protein
VEAGSQAPAGSETQDHRWLQDWFASPEVQAMGYVKLVISTPYDLQNEVIRSVGALSEQCAQSGAR